jgi:hypothetical protein
MDESQIRVRFDKDTDERLFARRSSLLARVSIAGAVRRISTGAVGYINGQSSADPPRWQVILDGQVLIVPEVTCGRTCSTTLAPGFSTNASVRPASSLSQ